MLAETAAGAFLVAGSAACAGAVIAGRPARLAHAGFAVALAVGGVGELAGSDGAEIAACAIAATAIAALVLAWLGPVGRLSWLGAALGAPSAAGLAVVLGADAASAVGVGGVACGLGLCRWRPGRVVLLALAGLAALAAGPWLALPGAVAFGVAAWLPQPPRQPTELFSPVVLAA